MCTVCAATSTFDPGRHLDDDGNTIPSLANIFESSDAAAGTWTNYDMSVGDTFYGAVGSSGDEDWIEIDFTAGQTIEIDLSGTGSNGLYDTTLELFDSSGNSLLFDDDGGPGFYSNLYFDVNTSGTYYISAGGWSSYTGDYSLTVVEDTGGGTTPDPDPDPGTGPDATEGTYEELADYLTDGYWEFNGFSGRSFDTTASNQITVNINSLTAAGQQLARWSFEAWEMVADIEFVEVGYSADIDFDDDDSGAYSTSSTVGGTINSSDVNISTSWLANYGTDIDDYSFSTYVHEIGHALGLGHQGAYNGAATYGSDNVFTNDSYQLSIMSYYTQTENTDVNASYADIITTMMADIIAIQNLYGAPGSSSATAGDTVWGANSTIGGYLGSYFDAWQNNTTNAYYGGGDVTFTIYDRDGTDTLDIGFVTTGNNVDMNGGSVSDIDGLLGNVMIAQGTVLENLTTGGGNDTVAGNAAANLIQVGGGADIIDGGDGADTVYAGAGDDSIFGGAGDDQLWGGTGNNTILGGDGDDVLGGFTGDESMNGGAGNDSFYAGAGDDYLDGSFGDDEIWAGEGNDTAYGGSGADLVAGLDGNDVLFGGEGNDTLWGGNGDDTLWGEDGDDEIWGGTGANELNGGAGADLLGALAGDDTFNGGSGADTIYASDGNDSIVGGADNDELWGGRGNDTSWGGSGDDTLDGYLGNDYLSGEAGNDLFFGFDGDDTIYGGDGNDTIWSGAGDDLLGGGAGQDDFYFASGADTMIDFNVSEDTLWFGSWMSGSGINNGTDIVNTYGSVVGGDAFLDFGSGNTVTFDNLSTLTGLADAIELF